MFNLDSLTVGSARWLPPVSCRPLVAPVGCRPDRMSHTLLQCICCDCDDYDDSETGAVGAVGAVGAASSTPLVMVRPIALSTNACLTEPFYMCSAPLQPSGFGKSADEIHVLQIDVSGPSTMYLLRDNATLMVTAPHAIQEGARLLVASTASGESLLFCNDGGDEGDGGDGGDGGDAPRTGPGPPGGRGPKSGLESRT